MRNAGYSEKVANRDVSQQHAWTVQKNSMNCVMTDQKAAKTVVKTELGSRHQKIRKVAEKAVWITRTAVKVIQTASPRNAEEIH